MRSLKVGIVILSFNNKNLIKNCLDSLKSAIEKAKTMGVETEIIVVDNGSTDGSRRYLERFASRDSGEICFARFSKQPISRASSRMAGRSELISSRCLKRDKFPNFRIILNDSNLGFAEGNNIGIREALRDGVDYVLLLNDDTLVDKSFLIHLIKAGEKNRFAGILGPKIYFAPGYEFHGDRYEENERGKVIWFAGGKIDWKNLLLFHIGVDEVDKGQFNEKKEIEFATGCCMLIKRSVFEKIGFFDSRYFLYLEDADFCIRAKKAGFKNILVPKSIIWHLNAGSSYSGSPLQDYFISRNRMLFGIRYAPWRTKAALFKESVKILLKGRKWQKIGIKDFHLRRFGKGSWKTING